VPRPICVIFGPTASGKSALAHEVARRVGGVVLAVDSMTVYRDMNIGTAKPSEAERQEVPYEAIDLVEPTQSFTVMSWLKHADWIIEREPRPIIACGGTPMYHKALARGLFDGPPADEALRVELDELSTDELQRQLAEVDPVSAGRLHLNDRKRLTRAIEVHRLTGQALSGLQQQWEDGPDRYASVRFGLRWDRPDLNRRINTRTKLMLEQGWLQEVEELLEKYEDLSPTAGEATGYKLLSRVARGTMKLNDAVEQIKIGTRQLAKRQMTWFRRFEQTTWLPGDADLEANVRQVLAAWPATVAA
jgi:tRNA dimethylallyltransferase